VDAARDLLDTLIVDRNGRDVGRVDGIELECRDGEPPRIAAVLIGAGVLASRLHPRAGRWAAALERALGLAAERPVRIAMSHVTRVERDVVVDMAIGETTAGSLEHRLRGWLRRIPGGK
jgi:sporulation protein YlmC with PRC-barrel domain